MTRKRVSLRETDPEMRELVIVHMTRNCVNVQPVTVVLSFRSAAKVFIAKYRLPPTNRLDLHRLDSHRALCVLTCARDS